jgi:hypothetical protein
VHSPINQVLASGSIDTALVVIIEYISRVLAGHIHYWPNTTRMPVNEARDVADSVVQNYPAATLRIVLSYLRHCKFLKTTIPFSG